MSDCGDILALLTAYVDGELDDPRRGQVDRHVVACPPCRGRLVAERGGRVVVRQCASQLSATPLPPGLETRCRALVDAAVAAGPVRAGWRGVMDTWPRAIAAAGVVLVVVGAVFALPALTSRSNTLLAAQLTADHVKCFAVFVPREATGRDALAAERQLAGYGWHMRVPPSDPDHGLQLLGVRRCFYADGTVPHVMYTFKGRPVSLFSLGAGVHPAAVVASMGHQCRIWQRDGRTYVLVAPADAGPMTEVARYVEREAR